MKNSYLTVTDQFCGAGGSSQGVRNFSRKMGGGIEVKLALNHWKLAIETHNTNFPDTIHDCTDISACDPRRYPSTHILITSPECTNHSVANGKKQVKAQMDLFNTGKADASGERSRATMWDVVRFAEFHKYEIIITENVVDARKWIMYDAWIYAMKALGYEHKPCFLNSMHFWPTPQSRDRMYVVFWKKGNKAPDLNYMPLARCPKCECDVNGIQSWKANQKSWKYKTGYVYCCPACTTIVEPYYYAAFNCIDWSIPGKRIGDRKNPLAENTQRRIKKGLKLHAPNPFLILSAYGDTARGDVRSISNALYTQTTYEMQGVVQQPFIINNQQSDEADNRIKGTIDSVLSTCSTQANFGLAVPMPLIIKGEHSQQEGYVKPINAALQTQATRQTMGILTGEPMIIELNSSGKAKAASEPLSTFTAGGINQGLLMPVIVENKGQSNARSSAEALSCVTTHTSHGVLTRESFKSFLDYQYGGSDVSSHITKALGTQGTTDTCGLVNFKEPVYEDSYYRTLRAHEVKLGMAFDKDYKILGDAKAQVK
ncbi:DNA cytosine methyltransferase [Mucilaginibacter sp.]|uniref:DNA cytosine methyltransferase n=1 Tax=Mucilaginibacter sp. TaxID=1882438 RepID=UPI0032649489